VADAAAPNILVIRRHYVGDLVLLGSFLSNLRLHWPAARLTVLADEGYAEILALNPDRPDVWQVPRRGRRIGRTLALLRRLRAAGFTHVFDIDNNDRTALCTRITGAPFRAGFAWKRGRLRQKLAYTHPVPVDPVAYEARHITEHYLDLLGPAGVPIATRKVALEVPEAERAAALALLAERNPDRKPVVLLHPGSSSSFRLWPADRFARTADRVQRELGAVVMLVGGPKESALLREIARFAETPLAVLPQPIPLARLAAVFAQARAVLCHDSGPMHIAAAVGTKVVALFGSQSRALWGPLGDGHQVLQAQLPCGSACVAPGQCNPANAYRSYCVRRIGEDEVFQALAGVLR
jgi:lipopolysaccharide heptosyltransferase II